MDFPMRCTVREWPHTTQIVSTGEHETVSSLREINTSWICGPWLE
jgi:hypothetical protein